MSYNNLDIPYPGTTRDQNYRLLPYSNQCDDFYPYFPQEGFFYRKREAEEPSLATAVVSSSSDVKTVQTEHSPTEEDTETKKQLRRIQNREAASRCRRKKMERISLLRQTLSRMYNRCQELRRNINAVEAEVRELKAAGYGQHVAYGQYQSMKNMTSVNGIDEPLPDLCLCVTSTDGNQPAMENQFQPEAGNHY